MEKYCINCGSVLEEGARFCIKCGASVTTTSQTMETPNTAAQSSPVYTVSPAQGNQRIARPIKKRKTGNILCIILGVLLVVESVVVALYGWPGFAVGGGFGKTSTYTLAEEETAVSTESGAAIDFGSYNAMDGEKITINELGSETDEIQGGYLTSYDISVEGREEFDGLLTITLPYDESKTIPGDEKNSVLAQYQNPETGEWELVDYTVNEKDNTVTIYTDHLSKYCTVTVNDPATPYARIAKIGNMKHMDTSRAIAIMEEIKTLGYPGHRVQELAMEILDSYFYYANFVLGGETSDKISLTSNLIGWIFDAAEPLGPVVSEVGEVVSLCGVALSTAQICHAIYQNDSDALVAAEGYKFAYESLISTYGTYAIKLSMLGVIAIDYSLNRFLDEANQTYKDDIYTIVKYYNEQEKPRTEKEWYDMILKLYRRHGDNPDKFNEALMGLMYHFSARFFQLDYNEQSNMAGFAGKKLPYVTIDAQNYCIEQYVVRLGEQLQPVIKEVSKRISYEAYKEYLASINKLRGLLNQRITMEVLEEIPNGEKSQYANSTVVLVQREEKPDANWTFKLDGEGKSTFETTTLGYIQAGCPMTLKLWLPGDDPKQDEPVLTQSFVLEDKVTTVVLEGKSEKYLLYQDIFEAGYGGGKTIEEFYETHPKMGEERNLEEFKRDYGVVFSIVSKNGKAVFMVTDAGMKKVKHPLYVYGVDGITGVWDEAAKTFYGTYGDGEEITIDFNASTALIKGPKSTLIESGARYGLQPIN